MNGETEARPSRPRALLAGIVLVAVAVRVAVAIATLSWVFPREWAFGFEMGAIASSLAAGLGFSWPGEPPEPTAWMAPVYPYVMAGVFELFGSFSQASAIALQGLQVAISAVTCLALFALGKRAFGEVSGLAAALLYALYPPAVYFAVQTVYSTALLVLCVLLLALLVLRLRSRPGLGQAALFGALLGFTALLEPVVLVLLPFAFGWLHWAGATRGRYLARFAAVAVGMGLLICAPWIVRNHRVFGHGSLLKSNFGTALYLGNHPGATGREAEPPRVVEEFLSPAEAAYVRTANEAERNSLYLRKAASAIAADPRRFARLTGVRVVRFWTNIRGRGSPPWQRLLTALAYAGVVALALASWASPNARGTEARLLWLLALSLPLPYYVSIVTHWRYRFPSEALLIVLAGHTLARLSRSKERARALRPKDSRFSRPPEP